MGRRKKSTLTEEEIKLNEVKAVDETITHYETDMTEIIFESSTAIRPQKAAPKKKAARDNSAKSSKINSANNIVDGQVDGTKTIEDSKEKVKRANKKQRVEDEMFIPETVAEEILFERSDVTYQGTEEEPFKKAKKAKAQQPMSAKKEKKVVEKKPVEKKVVEKKVVEKKVVEKKVVEKKVVEKKQAAQTAGPYSKYKSARDRWINYTLKNLSVSEEIKAIQNVDILVDCADRNVNMQSVLFHEWLYTNSVQLTPDSSLTLIVEDLGANNAVLIQALTSVILPRISDDTDGVSRYPSSVYNFDVFLNTSGPVWALALSETPRRSPLSSGRDT